MYELGKAVPIIPVITKADTMTIREAQNYKQEVFNRLQVRGERFLFGASRRLLSCGCLWPIHTALLGLGLLSIVDWGLLNICSLHPVAVFVWLWRLLGASMAVACPLQNPNVHHVRGKINTFRFDKETLERAGMGDAASSNTPPFLVSRAEACCLFPILQACPCSGDLFLLTIPCS